MRNGTHTDKLGRIAEDLAMVKLSALFEDCIVSHVVNNQLHDVEIRRKDEPLTKGICRIQVKSSNSKGNDKHGQPFYAVGLHHSHYADGALKRITYEKKDADFFLFYIFPEAKFYVFPTDAVKGKHGMKLYVGLPKPKIRVDYEKYLEAWELIADFLGLSTEEGKTIDNTLDKFM